MGEYFELDRPSPYMMLVADVRKDRQIPPKGDERELEIHQWVNRPRSDLPAVTHVDYSARIQTVSRETSPRYHSLIAAFRDLTGCAVLINTSFNVRGEPIVCTPSDAYRCFMRSEMDYLVLGTVSAREERAAALAGIGKLEGDARAGLARTERRATVAKIFKSGRLLKEFIGFARENRAYWIIPFVLMLGLTAFIVVATQGAAPLIYALF